MKNFSNLISNEEFEKILEATAVDNKELHQAEQNNDDLKAEQTKKRYGGKQISREDFSSGDTIFNVAEAYLASIDSFKNCGEGFTVTATGDLFYGSQLFVKSLVDDYHELLSVGKKMIISTVGYQDLPDPESLIKIQPAFINWIKAQNSLVNFGDGSFDRALGEFWSKHFDDIDVSRIDNTIERNDEFEY